MENKPYLVIARKYRPQTFEEVVGQEPVATTLKNAITLNRVGHAYLFTGPRGVGKTSMARIFSKALNCKNGPTVKPCGSCQSCKEIEETRSLDVLEIDGASNRGIDEIRTLRENVKFSPSLGKFKIYIIDEVHQITPDGFNALLKTLEEPPAHVKFIFATTAAHKVPATILSRCQRFDFRRISTQLIAETLKAICHKEKIKADEEALFAIAGSADGSLRDGQSILDQMASLAKDKVSKKDVLETLGVLEEERWFEVLDALAARDAKQALLTLEGVLKDGKEPGLFLENMLQHTRNLLLTKVSQDLLSLVDAHDSYKKNLVKQSGKFTKEDLLYIYSVGIHTLQILKRFEWKRIPVEMALVKLANRVPMESIAELIEKLKSTEKKNDLKNPRERGEDFLSHPEQGAQRRVEGSSSSEPDIEELPREDFEPKKISDEKSTVSFDSIWQPLLRMLKNEKISVASYLAEGEPVELSDGVARISFPERLKFHRETLEMDENRKLIERHLASFLDQMVKVQFESVKELAGAKEILKGAASGFSDEAVKNEPQDEVMKSAMNLFGGRVIRS